MTTPGFRSNLDYCRVGLDNVAVEAGPQSLVHFGARGVQTAPEGGLNIGEGDQSTDVVVRDVAFVG